METQWRYAYDKQLRVASHTQPLLCVEPGRTPVANREKAFQIAMEELRVPGYFAENTMYCTLYAVHGYGVSHATCTGIVVDCGDGQTQVAPMVDKYPVHYARQSGNLGGTPQSLSFPLSFYGSYEYDDMI